jgi:cobalt-zinc-cadmium efflux system membrane fusion protein
MRCMMRRMNRKLKSIARIVAVVAWLGSGCGDGGAPAKSDAAVGTKTAADAARGSDTERAGHPGRISLTPEQVRAAGIETAIAGPATVRVMRPLSGRIVANEDALAHMAPRFPGIVRSVHKRIGDAVAKGDLLAVIESNESLHPYEIHAQLAGVVLERDVAPGEFVSTDRPILTIGDLSTVWVDLDVYRRDFAHLARGQQVSVDAEDGRPAADATISYLAPIGAENTQTLVARAVLPNSDGRWRPGQFVSAQVLVQEVAAAVAVPIGAVQRLGAGEVVFVVDADVFESRPVELGARDDRSVEVVSGLSAGERFATSGTFILKAELGKSGMSHGS